MDRRSLLRNGLLAAAGALGISRTGARAAVPSGALVLTALELVGPHAELRDETGEVVGRLAVAPLGDAVELHTFTLDDGTIVGTGPPQASGCEASYAVIGGTGRYEAARGSYVAVRCPLQTGGDGSARFVFTCA